ncbi:hypothetical protein PFICI_00831 [Pestalotiopsis fici W106-1]|uniref:Uncharacterized protein n=1 Tax=Pestalotiopsis fici (strain W106-1 / CGMCC3.15140) TaxID=1229662 RepID=W3XLR4_PESFW|nr:uncharacterized protein PFICI_00831 [Pestalotiopsis fici W106-1]ETS87003.1 hypothetical protein PFICI_00831 [Pestalotiopsis fici W106-1]
MPRNKKGAKAKAITVEPKNPPKKPKVVEEWEAYFKKGDLQDWLRFMGDLGLRQDYSSITKCRKALKNVWVNIHDFLHAVKNNQKPRRFASQHELARYTLDSRKTYPKKNIPQGSPLRRLLAHIHQPSIGEKRLSKQEQQHEYQKQLAHALAIVEKEHRLKGAYTPESDEESLYLSSNGL